MEGADGWKVYDALSQLNKGKETCSYGINEELNETELELINYFRGELNQFKRNELNPFHCTCKST